MTRLIASILIWAALLGGSVIAESHQGIPLGPTIPKALGDPHPEGSLFMRINHMKLMLHDRDEVVLSGNREIKYSIAECVACHVVAGPDALPISAKNENHFCSSCHIFTAVKIDCFQCHNSKPDPQIQIRLLGKVPSIEELARYVEEVSE